MKKVITQIIAMALALAIVFTLAPVDVQAAAKLKLRTNAQLGGTYKVSTVLPGNVSVKANVTVTDYAQEEKNGITVTCINYHVEYPKAQLNKIKKNTTRILESCPTKKTSYLTRYVYGPVDTLYAVISAQTGKVMTSSDNFEVGSRVYNTQSTKYYQGRNTLEWVTSYDVLILTVNNKAVNGDVYIGIAGAVKGTTVKDKTYKKFVNGKKSIKKTNFYEKGKKNSSIWTVG